MGSQASKTYFFIPPESSRATSVIHSSCLRLAKSILGKSRDGDTALVPIEALDYIAIIAGTHIYFAGLADEQDSDGRRGLTVSMCWQPHLPEDEDINIQHIPMDLVYFSPAESLPNLQQQLTGEFYKALMLIDKQYAGQKLPASVIEMIKVS